MAQLWVRDESGWASEALNGTVRGAPGSGNGVVVPCEHVASGFAVVAPFGEELLVNGVPVASGLAVLRDRDEIQVGAAPSFFFSTEELARVCDVPRSESPRSCPRCSQRIEDGTRGVRCPACDVWYHENSELPCWTYAATCALCDQPTKLDAGFRFRPDQL